jgi:hypothetical protein
MPFQVLQFLQPQFHFLLTNLPPHILNRAQEWGNLFQKKAGMDGIRGSDDPVGPRTLRLLSFPLHALGGRASRFLFPRFTVVFVFLGFPLGYRVFVIRFGFLKFLFTDDSLEHGPGVVVRRKLWEFTKTVFCYLCLHFSYPQ